MRLLMLLLVVFFFSSTDLIAQEDEAALYNERLDGSEQLKEAVALAKEQGKHVLVQAGGNWCKWCILFHDFVQQNDSVKQLVDDNYIAVHLNYSRENENKASFEKLQFPQRFGFPVFVILNGEGERIHTQDSAMLESGEGYDREKVMYFFRQWSPSALDPKQYD